MFIADKLIYLQLPKTACTHISYLLSKSIGGIQFKKHNAIDEYNRHELIDDNKLIVGSIRNPWDWYVSLWAYSTKGKIYQNVSRRSFRNALKTHSGVDLPDEFIKWLIKHPFKRGLSTVLNSYKGSYSEWNKPIETWKKCYQPSQDPQVFKQWLKLIHDPERAYDLGVGYGQNSLKSFAGLMTYRYCQLFHRNFLLESKKNNIADLNELMDFDKSHNILDEIIRVENIESDVFRVLNKLNYQLDTEQLGLIKQSKKTNKSKHLHFSHYYDRETIDLVAQKEKFIIEKYSYLPPLIS